MQVIHKYFKKDGMPLTGEVVRRYDQHYDLLVKVDNQVEEKQYQNWSSKDVR